MNEELIIKYLLQETTAEEDKAVQTNGKSSWKRDL